MFVQAIPVEMAAINFGFKVSYIKRVIDDYGVNETIKNYPKGYTDTIILNAALRLKTAKQLYLEHGVNWQRYFPVDPKFTNEQQTVLTLLPINFKEDDYRTIGLKPNPLIKKELVELSISKKEFTLVTQNYKNNKEKNKEMTPLLGVFEHGIINIYCRDCRKELTSKWLAKNKCNHHITRKYYMANLNTEDRKRTSLSARFPLDAANEATQFYFNYINRTFNTYTQEVEEVKAEESITTLPQAIEWFLSLQIIDPKKQGGKKKANTIQHVWEMTRQLKKLQEAFVKKGYPNVLLSEFKAPPPNSKDGNFFTRFLDEFYYNLKTELYYHPTKAEIIAAKKKGVHLQRIGGKKDGDYRYNAKTINKMTSTYSSLLHNLDKRLMITLYNPFKLPEFKLPENIEPKAISPNQYKKLIEFILTYPELPKGHTGVSQYDLKWLHKAYILEQQLVGRRKDIVRLKWSDIEFDEDESVFVFKVGNNKATTLTKNKRITETINYPPISRTLMEHLIEWGYKKNIESEDYILQGEEDQKDLPRKQSRNSLEEKMSTAFGILGKMLFGQDFNLEHRSIRKLKFTGSMNAKGEEAYKQSHKSKQVFLERYIDQYQLGVMKAKKEKENGSE